MRLDGQLQTVAGLTGTTVRLVSEAGMASLILFSHLLSTDGFEFVDGGSARGRITPFALLDTVPPEAATRAAEWESHLTEVERGLPADAPADAAPRPEYDPALRTVGERVASKAAELQGMGWSVSTATVQRMRQRYRQQGLWGLVDHRKTRLSSPTGRTDARVVAAIVEVLAAQVQDSTGTRSRLRRQVQQLLANRHGPDGVPMPSKSAFYRLVAAVSEGAHSFGSAASRRSQARRPDGVFTPSAACRPGEMVQIDTTPLDVLVVLDDGVTGRPELSIAVDLATRTICAAVLRPTGTKAVDAALLLAKTLVPEPMRPGWADALRMSATLIPHARLLGLDARLEQAAAKPVIVPETIGIDHGKVFVSDTFIAACRSLGISVQPSRPATPTDKAVVERTFSSINTLFCQHVAGYVGSNVDRRGEDVRAVWTLAELDDLFQEWIVACWQQRPHEGLRSPFLPGRAMSPNDAYALLVARTGYLPVPLSGDDYLELLPFTWRAVNEYGVRIDHRTYNCAELNPLRRRHSGIDSKGGLWEVHYDPYDLSQVWLRDARTERWITVPWTHRHLLAVPFADFTWRRARELLALKGMNDTDQAAVAAAVQQLLTRAEKGPDRKVAARTKAVSPSRPTQTIPSPSDSSDDDGPTSEPPSNVIPFGVFDAFTDGSRS
ncbi:transposase InsO family protein [Kitasatospora sp. MAP12-15]|uniref:Mu transposase C-terminal domain-containing protein n=1 Tax=unclassified Kitasatospora TaxID=2633591 RepID=UPI002472F384|nr:Mu transposase C-terminal domain-containing protein [Kitasatospora sp. MAP12-44]MDH6112314.1 transposase InsO family protein [Kitasatospora sp. MAP12-44]